MEQTQHSCAVRFVRKGTRSLSLIERVTQPYLSYKPCTIPWTYGIRTILGIGVYKLVFLRLQVMSICLVKMYKNEMTASEVMVIRLL